MNEGNRTLTEIDIIFPQIIKEKSLKIGGIEKPKIDSTIINGSTGRFSRITIYGINQKIDRENFDIKFEFKKNLIPKGRFIFIWGKYLSLDDIPKEGNIKFILGKNYQCNNNCIYLQRGIEEIPQSYDRELKIKFSQEPSQTEGSFKLNTYSRIKLRKKNILLSVGISALISIIISILFRFYPNKKLKINILSQRRSLTASAS